MGVKWQTSPEDAWLAETERYVQDLHQAVVVLAQAYAPKIEAWMKENAPWTDRTGNARQSLNTTVEDLSLSMVDVVLAHGVQYGIWLELDHGGRFSILGPALDYWAPQIWNSVIELVRP